jgi:hypothetical protein
VVSFTPLEKQFLVLTGLEAGCAPELVRIWRKGEKSLLLPGIEPWSSNL